MKHRTSFKRTIRKHSKTFHVIHKHTDAHQFIPPSLAWFLVFLSDITSEKNRQFPEIRFIMVGNQTERRFTPGVFVGAGKISRSVEEYPEAQISFTMNNDTLPNGKLLKIGNDSTAEPTNPNQNPDFLQSGNDTLLHVPRVSELETNDEQSLRTWLKANIPNQSAPPSLVERLKNIPYKE